MRELFPLFNAEEAFVVSGLSGAQVEQLGRSLRTILAHMESNGASRRD